MHDLNKKCSAIILKCIWDINAFYKSLHNKTWAVGVECSIICVWHSSSYFFLNSGLNLSLSLSLSLALFSSLSFSPFTDRITSNKKSYIAHTSTREYDPFKSILLRFMKNLYKADDVLCNKGYSTSRKMGDGWREMSKITVERKFDEYANENLI